MTMVDSLLHSHFWTLSPNLLISLISRSLLISVLNEHNDIASTILWCSQFQISLTSNPNGLLLIVILYPLVLDFLIRWNTPWIKFDEDLFSFYYSLDNTRHNLLNSLNMASPPSLDPNFAGSPSMAGPFFLELGNITLQVQSTQGPFVPYSRDVFS